MAGPSAQAKWTPETSILRPFDKSANSDEWPSFVLTDAAVYRADGTTLVNALLVGEEGPFIVRGRLEADEEEDRSRFVRPDVRSAYIEIDASMLYSLGYDPLPLVWVSGRAGWFMITPSDAYTPIYNDICDVSVLYHHLLEIYNTAAANVAKSERKNIYAGLPTRDILFEYAIAVGDGITYDELVDKCVRLGPLLLAHCVRTNDIPWKVTGFHKWLAREIQDRGRTDRRSSRAVSVTGSRSQSSPAPTAVPRHLASPTAASIPSSASSSPSTVLPPSSLSHELPLRTPPRPPLNPSSDPPPATPTASATTAPPAAAAVPVATPSSAAQSMDEDSGRHAAVLQMLIDGILEIGRDLPDDVSRISQSRVHGKLYNKFRLKCYTVAKDLSAYFAKELLDALGQSWSDSPYGHWLRTAGAQPFVPVSPDFTILDMPNQLVRRAGQAVPRQRHASAAASPASTPQRQHQQRSAGKAPPSVPSARRGGKHAALRLPLASKKRPRGTAFADGHSDADDDNDDDDDDDDDVRGHDARRRKLAADGGARNGGNPRALAVDGDGHHNHEESVDEDGDGDGNDHELELELDPTETLLVVRSQPLAQSTAPTGPNRTWRCAQPGCGFFVRDAGPNFGVGGDPADGDIDDDDESLDHVKIAQELVRQHIRGHEQETLNKVDLAITEGSRRHVSVSHLLDKIRNMGDRSRVEPSASSALPAINGVIAPSPIVRHFLV